MQAAAEFALEDNLELYEEAGKKPLGFHSWRAFSRLVADGHIDDHQPKSKGADAL